MKEEAKRIMLIDADDSRRLSRKSLLEHAGYEVAVRDDYVSAEALNREGTFDLVIVALRGDPEMAFEYSNRLARDHVSMPVLLLTDYGVFVSAETLNADIQSGDPERFLRKVADMLAVSMHIRYPSTPIAPLKKQDV
jgi:DNA-binding NtrC family response regulator